MAVLKVQTETERPGIVTVRAKASPGHEMDAKPIGGFYVRRRYAGDEFKIASWQDFSPRWMEFVDDPPVEWVEKIKAREGDIELMAQKAAAENAKTSEQRIAEQMLSMANVLNQNAGTINQVTGKIKRA